MSQDLKVHRRKFVTVRVTTEEKNKIEEIAKNNKQDVSTYVRELILAQRSEQ
jgi:predicted DNA-binding protein